jgi:predicted membrane chloride channel (bestrophin family)
VLAAEWVRHRSSRRYVRHILGFPLSKLARKMFLVVAFIAAESFSAAALDVTTGSAPHLASATVTLLSFLSNALFPRIIEARTAWTVIVNRSADISPVSLEYIDASAPPTRLSSHPADETRARQLVRYVVSFPYILRSHLEASTDERICSRAGHLLSGIELSHVLSASNRPNTMLQLCTSVAGETVPIV